MAQWKVAIWPCGWARFDGEELKRWAVFLRIRRQGGRRRRMRSSKGAAKECKLPPVDDAPWKVEGLGVRLSVLIKTARPRPPIQQRERGVLLRLQRGWGTEKRRRSPWRARRREGTTTRQPRARAGGRFRPCRVRALGTNNPFAPRGRDPGWHADVVRTSSSTWTKVLDVGWRGRSRVVPSTWLGVS